MASLPTRPPLPIDDAIPALLAALRQQPCAVVVAPTGSGKTTRVPPALWEAGLAGDRQVLMLEPRRLAARAAARRMASERHETVGQIVGYQVRFDQKAGPQTRIRIVTDGILLRLLQEDPFLDSCGVVVFDEFHERGLNVDLALGMVRRIQQTVRPELQIVVMSATLDAQAVSDYLGKCPILTSTGRSYPVNLEYAAKSSQGSIEQSAATGAQSILPQSTGDVLVFLPGVGEIRRTADLLRGTAERGDFELVSLYGDLPPEQQDAALRRSARRKIVLTTNVAETSVTIEGITAVVDTGLVRTLRFDPQTGLDRLVLSRISKASADQRSGRAGRTEPGCCLRLWSEREQQGLADHNEPEIRRLDLCGAVLQLHGWGERDRESFPWFEAPPERAWQQALELLQSLGAIEAGEVTETGWEMARLPVHPRVARLLVAGRELEIVDRAALAAALLSERDPFLRDQTRGARGPRLPRHRSRSDLVDRVIALEDFERTGRPETASGLLHVGGAKLVLQVRDQLCRLMRGTSPPGHTGPAGGRKTNTRRGPRVPSAPGAISSEAALLRALLAAYPDRIARRREPGSPRALMVGGRGVRLADFSSVTEAELFVCLDVDAGGAESLVRQASAIEQSWLPEENLTVTEHLAFDAERQRVVATRQTAWQGLALEEVALALPGDSRASETLAAAAVEHWDQVFPADDPSLQQFLARLQSLKTWMPELDLPTFDDGGLRSLLPSLCAGCRSFDDLRRAPWLSLLQAQLTGAQQQMLARQAPERLQLPNGRSAGLLYEVGRPPVLAARIQDFFGWSETPRIAGGRVAVLLHLLAPNMRPQQVTDDLRSFWNSTYHEVRKELRRRYPKHAWPEDPWQAQPRSR